MTGSSENRQSLTKNTQSYQTKLHRKIQQISQSSLYNIKKLNMMITISEMSQSLEGGGGGGCTCYVRVSGDVPFVGYSFCPKILEQGISFEEKF